MTTLAIGPRTAAPSWEWVGRGLAGELATYMNVATFDDFAAPPAADITVVVKRRPPAAFVAAVKARGGRMVYAPIDAYYGSAEIAEDSVALRGCDLVLLHSEALRPHIAPYCRDMVIIEHHGRFSLATLADYKPTGFLLWIGACEHVPHLVQWLAAHPVSSEVRILTDLKSKRGRIAAHFDAHRLGLRLDFGEHAINGHPAFQWSEDAQAELMRDCRAAIDIKGTSFNQATKPPTKAQQFVASGIPFGCNPDSSVAAYFREHGFDVADAADETRLTSPRYFAETRAYAPRLRQATTIEAVGRSVLAALQPLLDHRNERGKSAAVRVG
ncbi:MAG: hypothetical protein ABI399_00835 [Bauldia sp.]